MWFPLRYHPTAVLYPKQLLGNVSRIVGTKPRQHVSTKPMTPLPSSPRQLLDPGVASTLFAADTYSIFAGAIGTTYSPPRIRLQNSAPKCPKHLQLGMSKNMAVVNSLQHHHSLRLYVCVSGTCQRSGNTPFYILLPFSLHENTLPALRPLHWCRRDLSWGLRHKFCTTP